MQWLPLRIALLKGIFLALRIPASLSLKSCACTSQLEDGTFGIKCPICLRRKPDPKDKQAVLGDIELHIPGQSNGLQLSPC
jgi:hypothetical protein